jgi:hypothetical protein
MMLPDPTHDLRHSFASFLVNQGVSLYVVQGLLGHTQARMTQRYAHLASQTLLDAAEVVASLIQGGRFGRQQYAFGSLKRRLVLLRSQRSPRVPSRRALRRRSLHGNCHVIGGLPRHSRSSPRT